MDATILLEGIKRCFDSIPKSDARARLGPHAFVTALVFAFRKNDHKRTIESIRQQVNSDTKVHLARSSFWQRLSSKRLVNFLAKAVAQLISTLSPASSQVHNLAAALGVRDIFGCDSSSITLPDAASDAFPGPRNNVVPASIKWHLCLSLLTGLVVWWKFTEAKSHDRKSFPPLALLQGALIIFDLGYWDYQLLADLAVANVFYLSRVRSDAIIHISTVVSGLPKGHVGRKLLTCHKPKKRKKIIEVFGTFGDVESPIFTGRVIGFWNKGKRCYHWYVTNLTVPAKLIYPLYKIRWQVELAFKACKSSLALADMPSACTNVIKSLLLVNIVAALIAFSLSRKAKTALPKNRQEGVSLQRAAKMFVSIADDLCRFLQHGGANLIAEINAGIKRYLKSLFDPNFRSRKSTVAQMLDLVGCSS